MDGRERLRDWLKRGHMNQRQGAEIMGMHFTHLCQILSGRRTPGLANAIRIEQQTGIPVEAWQPTVVGEQAEPALVGARNAKKGKA